MTEYQWFRTLTDIDDEIDNIRSQRKIYEIELKRWGTYSTGDLAKQNTYLTSVKRQNKIERILLAMDGREKELKEQRKEVLKVIDEFKGLEHDILKLKYIKGYKLTQVAEELGYSYQYIRNVHSDVMKAVRI